MASLIKDWRARADWETRIFVVFARRRAGCPFDQLFTVIWLSVRTAAREEAATCCRSDALLKPARPALDAFRTEPARKLCDCAGENIALYLYVTNMKLCEGLVSGGQMGQPIFFA